MTATYEDNLPFLASALTFDALLWVLPFVLVALSVFGYVVHTGNTLTDVQLLFDRLLPVRVGEGDPFARAEEVIARVVDSRVALTAWGAPLLLWFSLRLFGSVRAALNDVFDTEENRPWIAGKAVDLGLGLVAALFLTLSTGVEIVVAQLPWLGRFLASLSVFLLATALFYVLYRVAPSRRVRWDTALVAAVAAALAFEVAKRLYALYLANFTTFDRVISNANAIAALLFVLWVYYTAFFFLLGGEIAETYDLARRQREQRALLT